MIRVGKCTYDRNGKRTDPHFEGFTNILVLTKSSPYASLSPYCLKDEHGRIMESIFQFSKVYETIPESTQYYSRYDSKIIWKWRAERHAIKKEDGSYDLTPEYFRWRYAGMNAKEAIRYPVGYNYRGKCLFALKEDPSLPNIPGNIIPKRLDYIEGRKEIYVPLYIRLVKEQPQFKELKEKLANGENLLIIEVDAALTEWMPYYKEKYNVPDDFIVDNTMLATPENLSIMLNDPAHPYGHGFCLAQALLDIQLF